jgi:sugar phosphate permease
MSNTSRIVRKQVSRIHHEDTTNTKQTVNALCAERLSISFFVCFVCFVVNPSCRRARANAETSQWGRTTTVTEKIPTTPRVRKIQRAALTLLVISGAINTMDRAALAVANPLVRQDLGLSIAQMGALPSAFLWAYAFSQLPVGALIDRLGPRKLLAWGLTLWSGAQLLCGFVTSTTQFFFARMLLGVGEAPQFPTAGRVVRDWFAVRDRGLATGIFTCASTL